MVSGANQVVRVNDKQLTYTKIHSKRRKYSHIPRSVTSHNLTHITQFHKFASNP